MNKNACRYCGRKVAGSFAFHGIGWCVTKKEAAKIDGEGGAK